MTRRGIRRSYPIPGLRQSADRAGIVSPCRHGNARCNRIAPSARLPESVPIRVNPWFKAALAESIPTKHANYAKVIWPQKHTQSIKDDATFASQPFHQRPNLNGAAPNKNETRPSAIRSLPNCNTPKPKKGTLNRETTMAVCKANADFKLKDFTVESVEKDCTDLDKLVQDIAAKEQVITPLRNQRDEMVMRLKDFATRGRAGIKGYFGGNSSQYEQAGGTRSSERKKPVRKAKNAMTT